MKAKKEQKKSEVFIRSDGWVFSADGMNRLVEGGHKGHSRYEASMQRQMGNRNHVTRQIEAAAADILKSVKGVVPRALFLSAAIVKEAKRRAKKGGK